jgi:hypothetical protein
MWPLAYASTAEQDYVAYMHYSVATTRFSIRAIAEHIGICLSEPGEPSRSPLGFPRAAEHLVEHIERMPGDTAVAVYARDSGAGLARYLARWNDYGLDVRRHDLAEASALVGRSLPDWDRAQQAVDDLVASAGPEQDAKLAQYFYNWLRRQGFLLQGCGPASYFSNLDLQEIPER